MKLIGQNMIKALIYYFKNNPDQQIIDFIQTNYFDEFEQLLVDNYWEDIIKNMVEPQSYGLGYQVEDFPEYTDQEKKSDQGDYLIKSLIFAEKSIHLSNNQLKQALHMYCLDNSLDHKTFHTLYLLYDFIQRAVYSNDVNKAFEYLQRNLCFYDPQTYPKALKQVFTPVFLERPLKDLDHNNDPGSILAIALYYFMTCTTLDEILSQTKQNKDLHINSILLALVLGNIFYTHKLKRTQVAYYKANDLIDYYTDGVSLPEFENIFQIHTLNDFKGLHIATCGGDIEQVSPLPEGDIFTDAHNQYFDNDLASEEIAALKLAYGIMHGYISEKAHLLDQHKYNYNPDYKDYFKNQLESNQANLEDLFICKLKKHYSIDLLIKFLKSGRVTNSKKLAILKEGEKNGYEKTCQKYGVTLKECFFWRKDFFEQKFKPNTELVAKEDLPYKEPVYGRAYINLDDYFSENQEDDSIEEIHLEIQSKKTENIKH